MSQKVNELMSGKWFALRKRWQWLSILMTLIGAAGTIYLVLSLCVRSTGRFVKDWRYLVDTYLEAEASRNGAQGVLAHTVKARHPSRFRQDLDFSAYGEGVHFDMDALSVKENTDVVTQVLATHPGSTGKNPLPYPPQTLWCVSVVYEDKPDTVFFVGYHMDMYTAEWVVHRGAQAPFTAPFLEILSGLGCDSLFD